MTEHVSLKFTGERIVPEADNCEPNFALKMYQEHVARYFLAAQAVKGKTVIDIGCGIGYGSKILGESGAASVYAFDLSSDAIAHARQFYAHEAVTFDVESAHDFVAPEPVDVIVCFELIEHIEHQDRAIRRMARFLKPDGVLIMSTPRALEVKRTHFHTHEFSLGEFEDVLLQNFAKLDMYFQNNHFATMVSRSAPDVIKNIENINNEFNLKTADYFIAVASKSSDVVLPKLEDVFVFSNEAYVKLLERDVDILHRAEDDLKARYAEVEKRLLEAQSRVESQQAQLNDARSGLDARHAELAELQGQHEKLTSTHAQARRSLEALTDEHDRLTSTHAQARRSLEARNEDLTRQLEEVRSLLVSRQDETRQLRAENAKLASSHEQLGRDIDDRNAAIGSLNQLVEKMNVQAAQREQEHLAELTDWRAQSDALLRVIDELYSSTSWKLSAPVRALRWGPAKLIGGVPRVIQFWKQNGRAATVALFKRKLQMGGTHSLYGGPSPAGGAGRLPQRFEAPAAFAPSSTGQVKEPQFFDVVFFIGCWEGESKRYRVYNVASALEEHGYRVKVHTESDCHELVVSDWRTKAAVFFRTPYRESFRLEDVMRHVRAHGGKVVFDVDDLVFEPGVIDQIHGVSLLSAKEKMEYRDGVERYRRLLLECDFATVSTQPLRRAIESLGKPAYVIPNSLNREQIEASHSVIARKAGSGSGRLRIGYFSGSRTHERDFAQAEPALMALMQARDDVEFLLVGHLELKPHWKRFEDRVIRMPVVTPLEMLDLLASCDINIAPLEVGDVFCEAKSELKFFEAALVETPTIASATEPYEAAVEQGVSGYLARTPSDWGLALEALAGDFEHRRAVGRKAREVALERFGVEATARLARAILLEASGAVPAPRPSVDRSGDQRFKIDWIIPRLIIGGGGHRNILRAAHHLQSYGHSVVLHFTSSDDQAAQLGQLVRKNFYPFEGEIKAYDGKFRNTDVIMATHWTTVDAALRARSFTKEIFYFVQDFEPAFAPMGSEYVLAENTYRQGLYCVTSGPWCEKLLKSDYGCEADHFRFPIDRQVYHVKPRAKPNKNIIFFAKPDMPRRCFEIGSMMLAQLHRRRPDLEIILFGSGAIEASSLDFPATLLKIVPTIEDLATMYANADLGIAFSTTNPSLVPYEMMASGCPVVDLDRPGNEYNYDDRRDIAFLADPIPERMAEQISDLLDRPDELASRRDMGLKFAATFPTEEQMARRVEQLIVERLMVRGHL